MKKTNIGAAAKPKLGVDKQSDSTSIELSSFPIIGIGASAGGLEAMEEFLKHVPIDSGMAFIFVQHLDPNHKCMLCELLQRRTLLPVEQVVDRVVVKPDNVYVIPPGFDLSILHGTLHLLTPDLPHGQRLPIDYFFRSLAVDQKEHSVAVILSGMGSDGTLGARSIKEQAGAVFVQKPSSAKFDGMPRSAIDAGLADVVAEPKELFEKVSQFTRHVPLLSAERNTFDPGDSQGALEKVALLLRTQTGHDFSLYKKSTLLRRVERRMALHQLRTVNEYVRYIRTNSHESDLLFKELLIGVTNFFRDRDVWDQLMSDNIPALLTRCTPGGTLRAWVPACSTGEEAYTLAIVFREALRKQKNNNFSLQIFATDLDSDAIDKARAGVYPASIAADLSSDLLSRYFVEAGDKYRVGKEIREMVIFAPQNIVMDPPFTKLDILTCRNLLIYLESNLQKKLLPLFHYSLNPGGVLVLGSAETIGNASDLFSPCSYKNRIYERCEKVLKPDLVEFPAAYVDRHVYVPTKKENVANAAINLQELTEIFLLDEYTPAAVVATDKGDILYINGKTGNYLEPAAGKVNNNLFVMAREGLSAPLNEGFTRALRLEKKIELKNIKINAHNFSKVIDVRIHPFKADSAMKGMVLVAFIDVKTPVKAVKAVKRLTGAKRSIEQEKQLEAMAQEVKRANEDLQVSREDMQTSQEELKSTNEELQSTNEELQSTNEELTTSKEEMQSMNEELQTVNHELSAKLEELSKASDDMSNLLNSTDIATLFLDNDLCVRRFTNQITNIINLIAGDVGRPITDLVTGIHYASLAGDARKVLRTLIPHEIDVPATDERWFNVRIMPYRTQDNRIDGVVIIFNDISVLKRSSSALFESKQMLLSVLDSVPQRVCWKDSDLVILGGNQTYAEDCGFADAAVLKGKTDYDTSTASVAKRSAADDRKVMKSASAVYRVEEKVLKTDGTTGWRSSNKIPLLDVDGKVKGLLITYEDISERKRVDETLQEALAMLQKRDVLHSEELERLQSELKSAIAQLKGKGKD